MQGTLLGIAIALILALVAALVGPFFIDWTQYRDTLAAEATRLVGVDVRVRGAIDVRLLPSPSLRLHEIELGPVGGHPPVRARSLDIEFALGSLVRGELRAAQMRVGGPELTLGLGPSGEIEWPRASMGFDPDALSIERLILDDGRAILRHAKSGAQVVLDKFWFNGDVRSLAGPLKGEGAFVVGGELYGYRVVAGRVGEDGGIRVKVGIDPSDRPLSVEANGTVWIDRTQPRFEGNLTLARPAGLALGSGQTRMLEPWRLTARAKADADAALMEELEFQYGPDDRAVKLAGTAEVKFGAHPQIDSVLSARTIDLDRILPVSETGPRLPAQALKELASMFSGSLQPSIPVRIGLSVDALTLAGAVLQSVRGDLELDGGAWELERFEFRAPGATQVQLSGRFDPQRLSFTGPARVDSRDPKSLLTWLEGRSGAVAAQVRPLRLQGDVTFASDAVAVDRFRAELDRETIEGRFSYDWASTTAPARLDAALSAAELDLDMILAFFKAATAGTTLERPSEIALAVDIGRASIGGYTARNARAQLRYDANGLRLERLSVSDLGGAAFSASGRIETALPSPRGNITLDFDARDLGGVSALLAAFAPRAAERLRRKAPRLAPAKLQAKLDITTSASLATTARIAVAGRLGAMHVNLSGEGTGDPLAPTSAVLRLDGRLDSENGTALIELLGLDHLVAAEPRPAQLRVTAAGPFDGDLRVGGKLSGTGLDASVDGTMRIAGESGPRAALRLAVGSADARPLRAGTARAGAPLPVAFDTSIRLEGGKIRLDDLAGTVAGATARGHLDIDPSGVMNVDGALELDGIDASVLVAAAIGMPPATDRGAWSREPFGSGLFRNLAGRVQFKATRVVLGPALVARQVRGAVRLGPSELALEEIEASLAGGQASGRLTFRRSPTGVAMHGHVALSDVDAAALVPARGRPPVSGRLTLQLEAEGSGLSAASLFGSLSGNGILSLKNAQVAALDAKAFDMARRAADQGLTIDTQRVRGLIHAAMDSGRLHVPELEAPIAIRAGQIRIGKTLAHAEGADLSLSGTFDLSEWILDARLTLTGAKLESLPGAGRPDVFIALRGPPDAPERQIDVSALVGWLTLRAIEQQAKRLQALEEARRLEVIEEARRLRAEEEAKRREAIEQARRQEALEAQKRQETEKRQEEAAAEAARRQPPDETASAPAPSVATPESRTIEPEPTRTSRPARAPAPPRTPDAPAAAATSAPARVAPPLPPPIDIRPLPVPAQPRSERPGRTQTTIVGQPRPQRHESDERSLFRSILD